MANRFSNAINALRGRPAVRQAFVAHNVPIPGLYGAGVYAEPFGLRTGRYESPLLITAANIRAAAVSAVPLQSWRGDELDETSPFAEFAARPSTRSILHNTEYDLYLTGRAFWELAEGPRRAAFGGGRGLDIIYHPSDSVTETEASGRIELRETFRTGRQLPLDRMVIFRRYNYPKPDVLLRPYLDMEQGVLTAKAAALRSSITPRLVLSIPGWNTLTDAEQAALREQLTSLDSAANPATYAKYLIIDSGSQTDGGTDARFLQTANDAELEQTIKIVREAVAAHSGVAAPLLGSPDATTYSNLKTMERSLYQRTILPELEWITLAANAGFKALGAADGAELAFDTSSIPALRDDERERAQTLMIYANAFGKLLAEQLLERPDAQEWLAEIRDGMQ